MNIRCNTDSCRNMDICYNEGGCYDTNVIKVVNSSPSKIVHSVLGSCHDEESAGDRLLVAKEHHGEVTS